MMERLAPPDLQISKWSSVRASFSRRGSENNDARLFVFFACPPASVAPSSTNGSAGCVMSRVGTPKEPSLGCGKIGAIAPGPPFGGGGWKGGLPPRFHVMVSDVILSVQFALGPPQPPHLPFHRRPWMHPPHLPTTSPPINGPGCTHLPTTSPPIDGTHLFPRRSAREGERRPTPTRELRRQDTSFSWKCRGLAIAGLRLYLRASTRRVDCQLST